MGFWAEDCLDVWTVFGRCWCLFMRGKTIMLILLIILLLAFIAVPVLSAVFGLLITLLPYVLIAVIAIGIVLLLILII